MLWLLAQTAKPSARVMPTALLSSPHVPLPMRAPHARWAVEIDGEQKESLSRPRHSNRALSPRRFYGGVM
jgi:hypothetical protein